MVILFLIVVIDLIGFGIIIPLLPFYAEYFQADPLTVGLLMASYSLAQFVAAPVLGRLSDRHGRRPVLLFGIAGAGLSYVWMGLADTLWMLFAARILGGIMAGNIGAAFAYIADITTPANRAKGMGLIGAAFGLGFIIGPAIGGLLAGDDPATANYALPAYAAAALSFAAFGVGMVTLKESLSAEIRAKLAGMEKRRPFAMLGDVARRPVLALLVGVMFLATFVFAGMEATFAMWSRRAFGWGPEQNGYLFAFVGIVSAAIQGGLVGRLAKRFGERNLIVQGAVALAVGIALIPFSEGSLALLGLAMLVTAYGFSVINPSLNSLISLHVGDFERGGMLGIGRSASTLARVLGPAFAGLLFDLFGRNWPYYGGALVMALVIAMGLRLLRTPAPANG